MMYAAAVLEDNVPTGLRGIMVDLTEHRRTEERLSKMQRLESLGVLAGGIAHDFNNVLTAIMGSISLARLDSAKKEEREHALQEAETACAHAKYLTRELLTFSKGGVPVKKPISIRRLLRAAGNLALRGSKVKCEYLLPDTLWSAEADEGQLQTS
jgi:signal transduction histidine kinase